MRKCKMFILFVDFAFFFLLPFYDMIFKTL